MSKKRKYSYYIVALSDRDSVSTEDYRMALRLYHFGESPKTLYGVEGGEQGEQIVLYSKK